MLRNLLIFCFYFSIMPVQARTYTEAEGRAAWNLLKSKPLTETNFETACDLMQEIGQTHLPLSYEILAEYVPMVKATGNRKWVHILLMGWAKAKESLNYFSEAETLYQQARENAGAGTRLYREAIVGTVLMYLEWGKADSLVKYLTLGEQESINGADQETLSFIYTFRAMSQIENPDTMRIYLSKAIHLAGSFPDKNALFTAKYNYAVIYCQNDPQKQVTELDTLLELAKDSSLIRKPKLYERSLFSFRNAGPSVYYNLMQVNLLLTDFDNAGKFAQLFYDATIKPNPAGAEAPYFNAEMSIVKSFQGMYTEASAYLQLSKTQFNLQEEKIPYISYFIAAGILAEQKHRYDSALFYFENALKKGNTTGLYLLPPELYYAHALILNNQLNKAEEIFAKLKKNQDKRKFTAGGYYYYQYYAGLLKARNNYPEYVEALDTWYTIKDSLISLNRYRSIEALQTNIRIRDKEQEIFRLNRDTLAKVAEIRKVRILITVISAFAFLAILFLVLYLRNRQVRNRQEMDIQKSRMDKIQKEKDLELMQGVMQAEENERRKIAGELHDEVSSMLALANLNVSSGMEQAPGQPSSVRLQKAVEILGSVSSTIRNLSHRLNPLTIERYGFKKAIEELSETINLSGKLSLHTEIIGFDGKTEDSSAFLNDIYRIIQELLHNIVKHAKASEASLQVVEHEILVSVIVEDNGTGFKEDKKPDGIGLNNIRSKVNFLHGRMEISNKAEGGAMIVIEIERLNNASGYAS